MKLLDKYFKQNTDKPEKGLDEISKIKFDFNKLDYSVEGEMSEKEKSELYAEASVLNINETLKKILNSITQANGNFIAYKARTLEELSWARSNINAVELIKSELERLDNLHRDSLVSQELYNKADII